MEPRRNNYSRYRDIFKNEKLPLAFIDLENFDRNVKYVASTQKDTGKTIRVHTKSVRCISAIKRIFKVGGERFKGLMTVSMEETNFLADKGFDDFIVAYPTVQPSDLKLLVKLTKKGKRISLMVDSIEHLKILSEAGQKSGKVLNACIEVDCAYHPLKTPIHLGVRRSPLRTVEDVMSVVRESMKLRGVSINAIMGYEGHIAGPNDNIPHKWVMNKVIRILKRASIREFTRRRVNIAAELKREGLNIEIVNGGGSGSLISTGSDSSVTEVTAGSAFYASGLFWHYKEVSFVPSAFFATQIVRKPSKNMITCQGGGYIASGSPGIDKLPVPVYPEGMKLLPLEGAGEVQTPLILPRDCPELQLGDPVFFQHAKAGELADHFAEFFLIEDNRIVDKVKTYRGDGIKLP
jgi:D-serine deaminase-like pyridoxal phosphate-dependent protein